MGGFMAVVLHLLLFSILDRGWVIDWWKRGNGMKKALNQVGLRVGDWWLLALFSVLIIQSVYGLFCPLPAQNTVESIDIVFRTSEAAIFGYIISANFGRRAVKSKTITEQSPASIGFEAPTDAQPTATVLGKRTVTPEATALPVKTKKQWHKPSNTQQLTLVGIIGLVSLLVLIAWRNFYGYTGTATSSMTAVVTQYRDMVSGCVGFLIGQPHLQSEDNG